MLGKRFSRRAIWMIAGSLACGMALHVISTGAQQQTSGEVRKTAIRKPKLRPDVARFAARVDSMLREEHAAKAVWGIVVVDHSTGETLYERNADSFFTPASNTKLYTTAFGLATLGPDYHYRTTVESAAVPDPGGRVRGDVVLVGRGDPDLSNRKFPFEQKAERDGPAEKVLAELADAIVAKGVKQIDGDIIADDSYFAYDPYPEGWSTGDLFFGFGAPVSAIDLDDNTLQVSVVPGEHPGDPAAVAIEPWAGYDLFGHDLTTGPSASKQQFAVVREPGANPILLRGSIPLGAQPAKLELALDEPAELTAHLLKLLLESRGVVISGAAKAHHAPPPERAPDGSTALVPAPPMPPLIQDPVVLAEHASPPLIESIRLLNKVSQNLHAELLLRTIAKEKSGIGTTDAGIALETDFVKSIGIADGDVVLADGSGLSRQNLVTPRATATLLEFAARQSWGDAYISTLPVAAEDGTLEDRMKGTAAAGRIHAKTGSVEHVRSISGYATSVRGAQLVFSIFMNNNPQPPRDTGHIFDAICAAMVEEIQPRPRHK